MRKLVLLFLVIGFVGCAGTGGSKGYKYKFTCPDQTEIGMIVYESDLEDQIKLYDKVIEKCRNK